MLTRQPTHLFNDFFDLAWLILGADDIHRIEETWKQVETYRKALEKRLISEEGTPKAIKSCELNLSILLEVIYDIRMSEFKGVCQYPIYSRKLNTLKFLLSTSSTGQHPVVDAYHQLIHIFILLLNTVYTPDQSENYYQTLLWNSINIIVMANKFKLEFVNHQLNPQHMQAIDGLNPDILFKIYHCVDTLVTDKVHQFNHEKVGFMGANLLLKRLAHAQLLVEKSHPEPTCLAPQLIKSKKLRLDAVMIRLNLSMDYFKPLRIASAHPPANCTTNPAVLTSISHPHGVQHFYDHIRALTVRLVSCSHIFISNQITHGEFDAESKHEQQSKQKKYAVNHAAMTLQLENILCDAWLLHADAGLTLTAANKLDVEAHLDRIIRYAEGMLYQAANVYYVNRIGHKIAASTLADLDFRNAQSTYELAAMSHAKRQLGVIYFSVSETGLRLEFCGLNEKIVDRTIPWADLPTDFPRNESVILKEKSKYLLAILDHPSLIGYLLPLDGLSCLANSILRSRSEIKLGQAKNETERLAYFTELHGMIMDFMAQIKPLEQQTSQTRLFVMKQFIADFFFAHMLLCHRVSEFCELTKDNLCIAIDDLVSNTPNHALYSFVQTRHILKLHGDFSAEAPKDADLKPLTEITDDDFMQLVESQQIICTTAAPQIFNSVWIYFYNDIKAMIERNEGSLAKELHKRLRTYRASLENSLQLAVQAVQPPTIVDKSSFLPKAPQTKHKAKPKKNKHKTKASAADTAKFKTFKPAPTVATQKPKKSSLDFMEDIRKPRELTIDLNIHDECILKRLHDAELYPLIHGGAVVDTLFKMQPRDIDMLCFTDESTLSQTLLKLNIKGYRTQISKNNANVFSIYFTSDNPANNKEKTSAYVCDLDNPELRINQLIHYEYKLDISFIDPKQHRTRMEALKHYALGFGINWTLYYDYFAKLIYDPLHQLEIITHNKKIDVVFDHAIETDAKKAQLQFNALIRSNPTLLVYIIEKSIRFEDEGVKISKRLSNLILQLPKTSNSQPVGPSAPHKPFISTARIRKLFLTGCAIRAYEALTKYQLISEIFPDLKDRENALSLACEKMDARHNKNIVDAFSKHTSYHYHSITESNWCALEAEFLSSALYAPCVAFLEENTQTLPKLVEKACAQFLHQCKFYIVPDTKQLILDIWKRELRMKVHADVTPFVPRNLSFGGGH